MPARHGCEEHQVEFKKFEKGGKFWYSHKASDGWCKEPKAGRRVA
jgi:hypothetical protein